MVDETGFIRVVLADDHTVVRQGLSTMLNLHADIEVVGEAADGQEAQVTRRPGMAESGRWTGTRECREGQGWPRAAEAGSLLHG